MTLTKQSNNGGVFDLNLDVGCQGWPVLKKDDSL